MNQTCFLCDSDNLDTCLNGDSDNFDEQKVECLDCGAAGPWGRDETAAWKLWNGIKGCVRKGSKK